MACLYVDAYDPEITEVMMMAQEGKGKRRRREAGARRNHLISGSGLVTKEVLGDGIQDAHGSTGLRQEQGWFIYGNSREGTICGWDAGGLLELMVGGNERILFWLLYDLSEGRDMLINWEQRGEGC